MLSEADIRSIAKTIFDHSGAEETEVWIGGGKNGLTRFANNEIHQNVEVEDYVVHVRVLEKRRWGTCSLNRLDEKSLAEAADTALRAARSRSEDTDLLPLPEPAPYLETDSFDPETASAGCEQRASLLSSILERCRKEKFSAAGYVSSGVGSSLDYGEASPVAIANSKGLFGYYRSSSASFGITVMGDTGSGWAGADGHSLAEIDVDSLAEVAIRKARDSRVQSSLEPGKYTVILEPAAAADFISFLGWLGIGALSVQEKRSFMSGKLGSKVVSELVTIKDDVFHRLHQGRPFDGEGVPTRPVVVVENGVARSPVYDRQTAKKEGVESTGHSLPLPNTEGPQPSALVVEGGRNSLEEMISSTDLGVLVTRTWYMNVVEPASVRLTGMTRDGSFLIEHGKVTKALRNLRFNVSVVEMLMNVLELSEPVRAEGVVVPAMKIGGFNFTGESRS